MNSRAYSIIDFWFNKTPSEKRFKKDVSFDEEIRKNFIEDYNLAKLNHYDDWLNQSRECLALIILLDQFSRNLFRDSAKSFAQDYKTRLIVNEAIDRGYLEELDLNKIHFLLMPLIHSEDISDHIFGHKLIDTYLKSFEHFDKIKKAWNDHTIPIKKFGRYPHRNKILKRKSTPEEEAFLNQPDSSW